MVTSYNVRGLKDEKKLRHLISHYHKKSNKDVDLVVCLQETYLDAPGKIPYIWQGNYFMTESDGNSCGCVMLLSNHLTVVASRKIRHRGHVLVCSKNDKATYVIANIYAPNQNSAEKIDFFNQIYDVTLEFMQMYDCEQVILAGDFNLAFKQE